MQSKEEVHGIDMLKRYRDEGVPPSGSFYALLSNDLKKYWNLADPYTRAHTTELLSFCQWELPYKIWGSPEAVKEHIASFN